MDDTQALHHQAELDRQEQEESFYKRFDRDTGLYANVHGDNGVDGMVYLTIGTYQGNSTFYFTGEQAKEIGRHLIIQGDKA